MLSLSTDVAWCWSRMCAVVRCTDLVLPRVMCQGGRLVDEQTYQALSTIAASSCHHSVYQLCQQTMGVDYYQDAWRTKQDILNCYLSEYSNDRQLISPNHKCMSLSLSCYEALKYIHPEKVFCFFLITSVKTQRNLSSDISHDS